MIITKKIATFLFFVAFCAPVDAMQKGLNPMIFEAVRSHAGSRAKMFTPPLRRAVGEGNIIELARYISNDSDANARNEFGETLLHTAAVLGNSRSIQFLLDRGARINVINDYGTTPLHDAANGVMDEYADAVLLLLNAGAHFSVENRRGWTPLHYAVRANERSVRALLNAGAKVNVKTNNGDTPLDMACAYNDGDKLRGVIEILLEAGARSGKDLKSNY